MGSSNELGGVSGRMKGKVEHPGKDHDWGIDPEDMGSDPRCRCGVLYSDYLRDAGQSD